MCDKVRSFAVVPLKPLEISTWFIQSKNFPFFTCEIPGNYLQI